MLGDGVAIGPYCVVESVARLGDSVRLLSHAVVCSGVSVGDRTIVHSFAVLGGPPQHLGYKNEPTRLEIGPDCIIREHATMNRGTPAGGVTRVGARGFFMSGAHVGHDCHVGDDVIIASNAVLGGHAMIGRFVFVGGQSAVHQHCRVGDFAMIGGCAGVTTDVIPYGSAIGNHATLEGLNIVGMKRRGVSRSAIHDVRRAYRMLFEADGAFKERVAATDRDLGGCAEVAKILAFINADSKRPLMAPKR